MFIIANVSMHYPAHPVSVACKLNRYVHHNSCAVLAVLVFDMSALATAPMLLVLSADASREQFSACRVGACWRL